MLPEIRSSLFAIGLLLLVGCQRASSPDDSIAPRTDTTNGTTETGPTARTGPTASEVWAKTRAVYREAQSYTDNSTIVEYSVARARGVENRLPYHQLALAFERPDKIYLAYADAVASAAGKTEYRIASDGNIMRSWASEVPLQVHEAIAPGVLTTENFIAEPLLRAELLQVGLENLFPQLALLLTTDPDQAIFSHDQAPRLLRREKLAGRTCFRLQTHSPAGRRVLWIDQENYRLRRMELPIDAEQTALNPDDQFLKFSIWIDFADVCFDAEVPPHSFQLSVPPGGRRVRRFIAPPPPARVQPSAADETQTAALAQQQALLAQHEQTLAAATIQETLLPPARAAAPVPPRTPPNTLQLQLRWRTTADTVARPSAVLIANRPATGAEEVFVLDGGPAVVRLDLSGKVTGRYELHGQAQPDGGRLRLARDGDQQPWCVVSGAGWQQAWVLDATGQVVLTFPARQAAELGDVLLLPRSGRPALVLGHRGGFGVQDHQQPVPTASRTSTACDCPRGRRAGW